MGLPAQKLYTCQRCKKQFTTPLALGRCDQCWQEIEPQKPQPGHPWYEPKTPKTRRRRARKNTKQTTWSELITIVQKNPEALAPGWTKRAALKLSEFLDDEKRHQERLTWLQQNWSRSIELKQWIDGLIEMDARREWEEMRYGRSPIPNVTYMSTSDLETASNNLKAQLATGEDIQDWAIRRRIEREQAIESQNRANDRDKFFNMTYELSDDDFMLLKVYVHQLRTQRDKRNERACTSIDAARMLSSLTGKTVTEATYRKRIERFRKHLPLNPGTKQPYDIEIWVEWHYL